MYDQNEEEHDPAMRNPLIRPLYYENHPIANRRLNEAFDCGFAAARRRLLRWTVAMAVAVAVLLVFLGGRRAHAQSNVPIITPQLNNDYFVGQIGFPTIQSAVSRGCNSIGTGFRVVVPAGATPADTITAVTGCAKVLVVDQRSAPLATYSWNAAAASPTYQLQTTAWSGGPVLTAITLPADPTTPLQASTKQYVDAAAIPTKYASALHSYGDSITEGYNTPNPATQSYPYLIAQKLGLVLANPAIPGDQACDLPTRQIFPNADNPTLAAEPLYTLMASTNDVNVKGVGPYEAVFNACHQAALAWLALPNDFRVLGSAATTTGSTSVETANNWNACTTQALNASCSFTITTYVTGPLYLWIRLVDGNAGTGSYRLDGVAAGTIATATTPAIATQNGSSNSMGFVRIPSVAPGTHTLTMTQTSATGTTGTIAVGYPPQSSSFSLPVVAVGGTPFQGPSNLNGVSSYEVCNPNDAPCQQYNSDIRANVALLAGDGLDVRFVNVRRYLFGTAAEMHDALHPNPFGQTELQRAFQDGLRAVPATQSSSNRTYTVVVPGGDAVRAGSSDPTTYADYANQDNTGADQALMGYFNPLYPTAGYANRAFYWTNGKDISISTSFFPTPAATNLYMKGASTGVGGCLSPTISLAIGGNCAYGVDVNGFRTYNPDATALTYYTVGDNTGANATLFGFFNPSNANASYANRAFYWTNGKDISISTSFFPTPAATNLYMKGASTGVGGCVSPATALGVGTSCQTTIDASGVMKLTGIKSNTGTRFLCVGTDGTVTSSTTACSGT